MTTAPVFACSNSVSALSDAELLDALRDREIERRRAYRDQLRLIAEIDVRGVAVARGYRDVAALVREMFAVNPADARRMVTHARQLNPRVAASGARTEAELPVVADALADGVIVPEHVEAIHAAVRALPPAASIEDRVMAEKILCEAAVVSEPRIVARLGREIRQRLDPDGDPPRDEDAALPRRRLDISERHGGGVAGSFDLDAETGALLTALLSPLTEPRAGADGPDLRSPAERRGDAFAEVLRLAARCPDVPTEAGEPATLLVSVTLDQLRSGLGHGLLDRHEMLSAAQIRRLACDAKVVPVVLGSKSETLDVGRATRVVPRRIRRALIRRDKGCTFPSCARKAKWTEAHHVIPWAHGGPTSLANLTLLCSHHHHLLHRTDWRIHMIHGHPWYIPPAHIDPTGRPRRNTLHVMRT
ncbi:DUF222 domain-containing protein [Amycolatopsis sp. K13G38]|uniref:DUF222 domain-containing protein n=1 Tax=Amycolatopsis acididurans TaxID=2724524 RepID=A0ABX1J2S8_9PSEU|nr:HNH endonuclease signature motif containing protein [Amycolatopsis acididurans]NKQ54102.1 DUF222 domain-containing protein [Amycolatopsis acididurans]